MSGSPGPKSLKVEKNTIKVYKQGTSSLTKSQSQSHRIRFVALRYRSLKIKPITNEKPIIRSCHDNVVGGMYRKSEKPTNDNG